MPHNSADYIMFDPKWYLAQNPDVERSGLNPLVHYLSHGANEFRNPHPAFVEGKIFSTDWTSWNYPLWMRLLSEYRGKSVRILEIGSWEGRSAIFFLNYLQQSHVVCIDTFEGGEDHPNDAAFAPYIAGTEERFDRNTREFASRVEKIKSSSVNALANLGINKRRFDIVYIDGSHRAADVYCDAVLTWPLVSSEGIVIFDDYLWTHIPDPTRQPKLGIDGFLATFQGHYEIIHSAYQLIVRKF